MHGGTRPQLHTSMSTRYGNGKCHGSQHDSVMSGEHLRSRYGDGNERIGGTRPREAYQRPATEPTPSERTGRVREVRRRREPTVRQVPADATRPTSGDAHHDTQCEHHVQSQKLTRFIAGPTRPLPHHMPQQHSPVTCHVQSPGYSDFPPLQEVRHRLPRDLLA